MSGIGGKTSAIFGMVGLAFFSSGADTLAGRVVGTGSAPLAGVRVTIPKLNVVDTTGSDGRFELKVPGAGLAYRGGRNVIFAGEGPEGGTREARDVLGKSAARSTAYNRVLINRDGGGGRMGTRSGTGSFSDAMALSKSAAAGDTLFMSKVGWFLKKTPMPVIAGQDMGDVAMARDVVGVGVANYDKYDQQIVDAYPKHGLDSNMAMIVKAMIVIESSFNAKAISMYDTQLPCGTHSYGLIQVTPGCERGYATLPSTTAVTATIAGGLNGNPAVLTYLDPADKEKGNTIVKENGIVIDLVTDETSPLWAMSAFNPAYSIDNGAKALANVMAEMKRKFSNCTAANYMTMALAGYNQGSGTVSGCTTYSANGEAYQQKVVKQYQTFCKGAGMTPVY